MEQSTKLPYRYFWVPDEEHYFNIVEVKGGITPHAMRSYILSEIHRYDIEHYYGRMKDRSERANYFLDSFYKSTNAVLVADRNADEVLTGVTVTSKVVEDIKETTRRYADNVSQRWTYATIGTWRKDAAFLKNHDAIRISIVTGLHERLIAKGWRLHDIYDVVSWMHPYANKQTLLDIATDVNILSSI